MSVKTIFKTLIGTIVCIVIISVCVELFNVNVSGLQIKTVCNMTAKQSAELFTQETYKGEGDVYSYTEAKSANMKDIKAADGTVYISGNFYGNSRYTRDIWNNLYGASNTTFKNVCTMSLGSSVSQTIHVGNSTAKTVIYKYEYCSPQVKYTDETMGTRYVHQTYTWSPYKNTNTPISVYRELGQLYAGIHESSVNSAASAVITFEQYRANAPIVRQKSYAINAKRMKSKYYTPVNVGFPYFDAEVTNKIFQWDLAMILSNGLSESIVQDESGTYYINYKGFRCYVQDAYITNFNYYIIDAKTDSSQLRALTNMDASNLRDVVVTADNDVNLENSYVTVVGIEYTIPIAYQGITPLKNIFEYVWNNEVNGQTGSTVDPLQTDRSGMTGTGTFSYATQNMTNSSSAGNGALPATGEIYYVLVR